MLAHAHELNAMARAMLQSQDTSPNTPWERPAPSTTRRITTKVFPWLKPDSLRTLASHNGKPPEAPSPASETPGPQAIADAAKELLGLVDLRRKNLDDATTALTNARVHLHTLQARADTAPLAPTTRRGKELVGSLQEQIAEARARVRTTHRATQSASQQLQEVLHSTDLLHLTALTENQDQQTKRAGFSRQWLTDLKGHLQAVDTQLADRHTAITLEMELKTRQTRELIALDHDMIVAERAQLSAETYLQALHARLPGTAEGSSARAALNTVIEQAESERDKFRDEHQRLANNMAQVSADCAQLNDDIAALYKQLGSETRRRQVEPRAPAIRAIDERLQQSTPPADEARPDKAAIDAIQARYMTHQLETAQAFPAATGADLDALKAVLQPMGERLSSKEPATTMPAFAVMETITSALAEVTGQDAKRAARILGALSQQPAAHWPVMAEGLAQSQRAGTGASTLTQDIVATCRKLASLPCGIDLLRVLSSEGSTPATQAESDALQVFWQADNAQQANPSPEVKAWLQSAKAVARGTLEHTDTAFADVAHGAFNAVRNGYFSNAPGSLYDQHDQRLKKATVEWVMRAAATQPPKEADPAPKPSAARRLLPNVNKTPFGKDVLSKAYDVSEGMGMQSPRRTIDKLVTRRLDHLQTTIDACRALPERRLDVAAAQAMVDHLRARQKRGDHLSQVALQTQDIKTVRLSVTAKAHEQRLAAPHDNGARRQPNVLTKAQPVTLPALYEQLGTGELSAFEGVSRIEEQLRKGLPADQRPALYNPNDDELADTMRLLKNQHLSAKSDIVTFFKPFMLEGALRDRLRLGGGGTVGGGLPSLPYGVISPIASPVFSAEVSRSDEAFVQMSLPSLGIEMAFGKVQSKAWEVSAGVSTGTPLAPLVGVQGSLTGRIANEKARTTSTTMRFYGERNKDDETRNHMINALDSMTRWDVIDPDKGPRYKGPLEAIFARNPSISLSQAQSTTSTHTLGMRLAGRLPAMSFADGHGASQSLSLEAALSAEASRSRDVSNDTGGTVATLGDKSDIAQQRLGLTTNFNMTPIASSSVPAGNGHHGVLGQGLGLQAGVSRDLAWAFEKNEISPYLYNGKLGADLERQYSTPKDLLAEINTNRDLWLQVALKKLEPDASGNKDTADNRLRAGILLSKFETRLKQLAKDNHYCLYSIVYEMKPRVGAAVDGYRGIQELARQRGDAAGVARAEQAIEDIMLMRGSWEPKYMTARERAGDSTSKGWRNLVRWQKLSNVNAQRTAALFPPP
ncbi:type III effector [Pseudomonas sp. SDO528_S397]